MSKDIRSLVDASLSVKEGWSAPLEYSTYSLTAHRCDQSQPIILDGEMWFVMSTSYKRNFDYNATSQQYVFAIKL